MLVRNQGAEGQGSAPLTRGVRLNDLPEAASPRVGTSPQLYASSCDGHAKDARRRACHRRRSRRPTDRRAVPGSGRRRRSNRCYPSGTDNAIFRLGDDKAVRLPRIDGAVGQVEKDRLWLPALAPQLPFEVPELLAAGVPSRRLSMGIRGVPMAGGRAVRRRPRRRGARRRDGRRAISAGAATDRHARRAGLESWWAARPEG